MNIFEKVNIIKKSILDLKLNKTGKNSYAGYSYYELEDLIPSLIKLLNENKVFMQTTFNNDVATLKLINIEKTDEILEYTSPMKELELKGCNAIQNLGGVETYQRRYLILMAFDIVEPELFDKGTGKNNLIKEVKNTFENAVEVPTLEEVENYAKTKGYEIDSKVFLGHIKKNNIKFWQKYLDKAKGGK